ncbi:uncharacterized protein RHO25_003917 [Cercospora beticola]|nr:hypothetical protein RHO25_003917 [Cercospora beticola]CAK1360621.1 unnamed protein product [Cercospora beticola]
MFMQVVKYASITVGSLATLYLGFLGLLTTSWFQAHVVYLHAVQMTWFKDLNFPEIFGFLHNQVTPFEILSSGGGSIYAWHVLPVEVYRRNEQDLLQDASGFALDVTTRKSFSLLQDDPEALLIIHFHGAGGTVGSGYRCPNYRALSAGKPDKIHVLTFDYRGFGRSKGVPTERSVTIDAISVVEWALHVAKIPPSRILMYGQSLGTAVNIAIAEHYAQQEPPITFVGHVLTAPFVDVPTLVSTYSVAGTVPILGPVAKFPAVFNYLRTFIQDKWSTRDRIASYVKANEAHELPYQITILHAEDDYDIPWTHTPQLFWHAVNASQVQGITYAELDQVKSKSKVDLGHAGTVVEWRTEHGVLREEILKHGLHDVIMGNPIISLAVLRMFEVYANRI